MENRWVELGAWRSPVAHSAGGRGVAGSNPVAPTLILSLDALKGVFPLGYFEHFALFGQFLVVTAIILL